MEAFRDVADHLLSFTRDHVYLALFLLLLVEETGLPLPVPGDALILLAGAGIARGEVNRWLALLLIVLAVMLGSTNLYWLSRLGGWTVLRRVARAVRVREERLQGFGRWMRRHPAPVVVIGRLTPGFRIVTSAAAGTFRLSYPVFVGSSALAALIWAAVYLSIGAVAHNAYRSLAHALPPGPLAVLLLAFVIAALVVALRRRARAPARNADPHS